MDLRVPSGGFKKFRDRLLFMKLKLENLMKIEELSFTTYEIFDKKSKCHESIFEIIIFLDSFWSE